MGKRGPALLYAVLIGDVPSTGVVTANAHGCPVDVRARGVVHRVARVRDGTVPDVLGGRTEPGTGTPSQSLAVPVQRFSKKE